MVCVLGLNPKTLEEDFKKAFMAFGNVIETSLVTDPRTKQNRGFGFITMSTLAEMQAILDGPPITIDGTQIKMEKVWHNSSIINNNKARRTKPRTKTPGRYLGNKPNSRSYYPPAPRGSYPHGSYPPYQGGYDPYYPPVPYPPRNYRYSPYGDNHYPAPSYGSNSSYPSSYSKKQQSMHDDYHGSHHHSSSHRSSRRRSRSRTPTERRRRRSRSQ